MADFDLNPSRDSRLLKEMGLPKAERNQIEGIHLWGPSTIEHRNVRVTEAQFSMLAIGRLARSPPLKVGRVQRLTARRLLRPYPLGLRVSGTNMSPLPLWLSGAQFVALNMSNNDVALQLHFTLFSGSEGFLLKPSEMLRIAPEDNAVCGSGVSAPQKMRHNKQGSKWRIVREEVSTLVMLGRGGLAIREAACWPPLREEVHVASITIVSLHNFPKVRGALTHALEALYRVCTANCLAMRVSRGQLMASPSTRGSRFAIHSPSKQRGECRPRFDGSRGECHQYAPELSGAFAPPNKRDQSYPTIRLSMHAVGGTRFRFLCLD